MTLKPWFLIILAALAGLIGLASSAVTAEFFIAGLQNTETSTGKTALIAAGILMIAAEVVAFFIAAVLPKNHSLRLPLLFAGFLILIFEAVTVFSTQHALIQTDTAAQTAAVAKIDYLRSSIAQNQATAASLTMTAQEQVASRFIAQRENGAENLRKAEQLQSQAAAQVKEMSELLSSQKTTLTDTFGSNGMLIYSAARSLLLTITGLIMMSAAGALLRAAVPSVPTPVPATPVPSVPVVPPANVPAVPVVPATPVPDVPTPGTRYAAARAALISKTLTSPTVRSIQALVGGNTSAARAIQACFVAEGLIERLGKNYRFVEFAH